MFEAVSVKTLLVCSNTIIQQPEDRRMTDLRDQSYSGHFHACIVEADTEELGIMDA
jgi:hypothetical protein